MENLKMNLSYVLFSVIITFLIITSLIYAWSEPDSSPPTGNAPAPLNVSNTGQMKSGGLWLNYGGAETGLIVGNGAVGIGTTTASTTIYYFSALENPQNPTTTGLVVNGDLIVTGTIIASYYIPYGLKESPYVQKENNITLASIINENNKEIYYGRGNLINKNNGYEMILDFSKIEKQTEAGQWFQKIDFSKNNIDVLMTPRFKFANLYYEIQDQKIIFKGDKEVEFSYQLIGGNFPQNRLNENKEIIKTNTFSLKEIK